MSPMEIMKVWQLWSLTYSEKKRTEFVGDIQAMIDYNPSRSIRFIAQGMEVTKFLIRQVVHEDIWYFSY